MSDACLDREHPAVWRCVGPDCGSSLSFFGGARWQQGVINDLVLLSTVGIRPVLVHGGGPEINIWLNKLGIEAQFKNGLRVTDGVPPAQDCPSSFRPGSHVALLVAVRGSAIESDVCQGQSMLWEPLRDPLTVPSKRSPDGDLNTGVARVSLVRCGHRFQNLRPEQGEQQAAESKSPGLYV